MRYLKVARDLIWGLFTIAYFGICVYYWCWLVPPSTGSFMWNHPFWSGVGVALSVMCVVALFGGSTRASALRHATKQLEDTQDRTDELISRARAREVRAQKFEEESLERLEATAAEIASKHRNRIVDESIVAVIGAVKRSAETGEIIPLQVGSQMHLIDARGYMQRGTN